jgi:hypothetical protein
MPREYVVDDTTYEFPDTFTDAQASNILADKGIINLHRKGTFGNVMAGAGDAMYNMASATYGLARKIPGLDKLLPDIGEPGVSGDPAGGAYQAGHAFAEGAILADTGEKLGYGAYKGIAKLRALYQAAPKIERSVARSITGWKPPTEPLAPRMAPKPGTSPAAPLPKNVTPPSGTTPVAGQAGFGEIPQSTYQNPPGGGSSGPVIPTKAPLEPMKPRIAARDIRVTSTAPATNPPTPIGPNPPSPVPEPPLGPRVGTPTYGNPTVVQPRATTPTTPIPKPSLQEAPWGGVPNEVTTPTQSEPVPKLINRIKKGDAMAKIIRDKLPEASHSALSDLDSTHPAYTDFWNMVSSEAGKKLGLTTRAINDSPSPDTIQAAMDRVKYYEAAEFAKSLTKKP